jgi:hypothetical protein
MHRRLALGEGGVYRRGELHGIAVAANMHIQRCRRRPQQMIVKSRNVDAALHELIHHVADLFGS